jgi:WD40 repeat protein
VWSTADWRLVAPPLNQPTGFGSASVAADDRLLASASSDGTIALWDLATGRRLGTPLPGPAGFPSISFTPDGHWLFASYSNGQAYRWDMRPASWRAKACAVAGRALTRAEWTQLEPSRPYTPVCPQPH